MGSLRNIRFVLAVLIMVVVIVILAAIFYKGSKSVPLEPILQQLPRNIDVALHNAHFTEMRDGLPVWELISERAEYDKAGDMAHLSGIEMKFAKTRFGKITLTAAKGDYSTKTRNVTLRVNIHLMTENGVTFDTDSIDYFASRSQFKTDAPVTFHEQRLSLVARGMVLNLDDQKIHFGSAVDATVEGFKSR